MEQKEGVEEYSSGSICVYQVSHWDLQLQIHCNGQCCYTNLHIPGLFYQVTDENKKHQFI